MSGDLWGLRATLHRALLKAAQNRARFKGRPHKTKKAAHGMSGLLRIPAARPGNNCIRRTNRYVNGMRYRTAQVNNLKRPISQPVNFVALTRKINAAALAPRATSGSTPAQ